MVYRIRETNTYLEVEALNSEATVTLTFQSTVVNMRTICFNTKGLCILVAECIYALRMSLTIYSDYLCIRKQYYQVGILSGDTVSFLRGTNCSNTRSQPFRLRVVSKLRE
jgi:hypothetical protein